MGELEYRVKEEEDASNYVLPSGYPILARLDGRSFTRFTRHAQKPFSKRFQSLMRVLASRLMEESGALFSYVVSDEITLGWHFLSPGTEMYFGNRTQKIASSLAAFASVEFNSLPAEILSGSVDGLDWKSKPKFDCRVWWCENTVSAFDALVCRYLDAIRNSVSMACRAHFSHAQMHGQDREAQLAMLREKGVEWSEYDPEAKWGTWLRKCIVERAFTAEEIEKLPPLHNARKDPNLKVARAEFQKDSFDLALLVNGPGYFFHGQDPIWRCKSCGRSPLNGHKMSCPVAKKVSSHDEVPEEKQAH